MKVTHPHPKSVKTDGYGTRGGTHSGLDFATTTGDKNILAFANGVVHTAMSGCVVGNSQCNGGAGNFVVIDHENGYYTRYLHLDTMRVKKGQRVAVGQVIGIEGNTGYSTGAHLHFELRTDAGYGMAGSIDPTPYLNGTKTLPDSKKKSPAVLVGGGIGFMLLLVGLYLWTFKREQTQAFLSSIFNFKK